MKQILGLDIGTVTFTPGGAGVGTIVIAGMAGFSPSRLLYVTNVTRKTLIYAAEKSGAAGAWSSVTSVGGTLTLDFNTTGHNSADVLRAIYQEDDTEEHRSIEEICMFDGFPTVINQRWSGINHTTRTVCLEAYGGTNGGGIGDSYYMKTLEISTNRYCEGQVVVTPYPQDGSSRGTSFDYRRAVNGCVIEPVEQLTPSGVLFANYIEWGDGAPIVFRYSIHGYVVSADHNFGARRTVLWIGDSIPKGSGVPNAYTYDPSANYPHAVRDWLVANGHDYRLINKSVGGSTTATGEAWRKDGNLTLAYPRRTGLVFYNLGTNDSTDPATALANMQLTVTYLLANHPNATIIVLGPTPVENNTTEAGIATIRGNYSTYVSGLANPRVKYLSLGSVFDRTNPANFSTSDPAGNRVHPAPSVMPTIATTITNFLATVDIP